MGGERGGAAAAPRCSASPSPSPRRAATSRPARRQPRWPAIRSPGPMRSRPRWRASVSRRSYLVSRRGSGLPGFAGLVGLGRRGAAAAILCSSRRNASPAPMAFSRRSCRRSGSTRSPRRSRSTLLCVLRAGRRSRASRPAGRGLLSWRCGAPARDGRRLRPAGAAGGAHRGAALASVFSGAHAPLSPMRSRFLCSAHGWPGARSNGITSPAAAQPRRCRSSRRFWSPCRSFIRGSLRWWPRRRSLASGGASRPPSGARGAAGGGLAGLPRAGADCLDPPAQRFSRGLPPGLVLSPVFYGLERAARFRSIPSSRRPITAPARRSWTRSTP